MSGYHKDLAEKAFHSVLALVPRPYNKTKYGHFESRVTEKFKEYPFYGKEQEDIVSLTYFILFIFHFNSFTYDFISLYVSFKKISFHLISCFIPFSFSN
jgi:hypothetical protein